MQMNKYESAGLAVSVCIWMNLDCIYVFLHFRIYSPSKQELDVEININSIFFPFFFFFYVRQKVKATATTTDSNNLQPCVRKKSL